jgi:hypothetical protein
MWNARPAKPARLRPTVVYSLTPLKVPSTPMPAAIGVMPLVAGSKLFGPKATSQQTFEAFRVSGAGQPATRPQSMTTWFAGLPISVNTSFGSTGKLELNRPPSGVSRVAVIVPGPEAVSDSATTRL